MDTSYLLPFLGKENVEQLQAGGWPSHFHVGTPVPEVVSNINRELGREPLLTALLRSRGTTHPSIRAFRTLPNGGSRRRRAHTIPRYLYCRSHYCFLFDDCSDYFPILRALERNWAPRMGILPEMTVAKLSFSRKGAPFPLHFDRCCALQIQLRGTKEWWLAPNNSLTYPLSGHVEGTKAPACLKAYYPGGVLPAPEKFEKTVLRPGDVMFVPWAYWHKTLGTTNSLSIALTFRPPSWIDFLPAKLHERYFLEEEWHAPAVHVWEGGAARERGIQRLSSLIETSGERDLDPPSLLFENLIHDYNTDSSRSAYP